MDFPAPGTVVEAHELRVVQQLLWPAIEAKLRPVEREEVKSAVGRLLIEENEGLFQEASALSEIIGDVKLETTKRLQQLELCRNAQRKLVESEIELLIDKLRAVSMNGSQDPEAIIPKNNVRDKAVYDYITNTSVTIDGRPRSAGSRPGTALRTSPNSSRPGTAALRPGTAPSRPGTGSPRSRPTSTSSNLSASSTLDHGSILESVKDKLNAFDIDLVKTQLQTALADEKQCLLEDIEYLTGLLEEEADFRGTAADPPTLNELKDYSSKLAVACDLEEKRVEHEIRVNNMFQAASSQQAKPARLRAMVQASRESETGSPSPHQKTNGSFAPDMDVLSTSVTNLSFLRRSSNSFGASVGAEIEVISHGGTPRSTNTTPRSSSRKRNDAFPTDLDPPLVTGTRSPICKSSNSSLAPEIEVSSSSGYGRPVSRGINTVADARPPSRSRQRQDGLSAEGDPLLGSSAALAPGRRVNDSLEAEVDAVLSGGVQAILAKHNYSSRPSTPASRPASAGVVPSNS